MQATTLENRDAERHAHLSPAGWRLPVLSAALFLLAVLVRAPSVDESLPYVAHWDEPTLVRLAVDVVRDGRWNPEFFNYPSLPIYLNAAALRIAEVFGFIETQQIDDVELGDQAFPWSVSEPKIYRIMRWSTVLVSALAIPLVLVVTLALTNRWTASVGAALLACFAPLHLGLSHWITPNPIAVTLSLVSVACVSQWLRVRGATWLVFAGLTAGLATSSKYNYAVVGIAGLLLLAIRPELRSRRVLVQYGAAVALGFLMGTPFAVLDPVAFWEGAFFEVRHYTVDGHAEVTVARGVPHLLINFGVLARQFGVGCALVALGSLAWLRSRPLLAFVWLVLGLQVGLTSLTTVAFDRNIMLAAVLLPVCAWTSLTAVAEALARRVGRPVVSTILIGLGALFSVGVMGVGLREVQVRAQAPTPARTLAAEWIAAEMCETGAALVIDETLRFHPLDLAKLEACAVELVKPEDVFCRDLDRFGIVGLGYETRVGAEALHERVDTLNRMVGLAEPFVLRSWGFLPVQISHFMVQPRMGLLGPGRSRPGEGLCSVPLDLGPFGPLPGTPSGGKAGEGDAGQGGDTNWSELAFGAGPDGALQLSFEVEEEGVVELGWQERSRSRPGQTYRLRAEWLPAASTRWDEAREVFARGVRLRGQIVQRRLAFGVPDAGRVDLTLITEETVEEFAVRDLVGALRPGALSDTMKPSNVSGDDR